jgi:hypothetical protein
VRRCGGIQTGLAKSRKLRVVVISALLALALFLVGTVWALSARLGWCVFHHVEACESNKVSTRTATVNPINVRSEWA